MYIDQKTGYFCATKLDQNFKKIKKNTSKVIEINTNSKTLFLNLGGTITSGPTLKYTGVQPLKNLLNFDFKLKKLLEHHHIDYCEKIMKLSEDWGLKEYYQIKSIFESFKEKKIFILTYGTDNISFFGPWIDVLCKLTGHSALILVSQRSWDRPTSELPYLLSNALNVCKKLKKNHCYVMTYALDKVFLHSPYEIQKYHTTKKSAFYSKNQKIYAFKDLKWPPSIKFKTLRIKEALELKELKITLDTPFSAKVADLLIYRGTGNSKKSKKTFPVCTIVNSGPLNPYLYSNQSHLKKPKLQYSWQALVTLKTFTEYACRD